MEVNDYVIVYSTEIDMPTIVDVARVAGVSTATVSHALNNTRYVDPQLRERVLKAAQDLGYHRNAVARGLRTKRTRSLGLIIPDIANQFFPEFARGVQDAATQAGYTVVLCNTDWQKDKEHEFLNLAQQGLLDGIILNPSEIAGQDLSNLIKADIHIVLIGSRIDHPKLDQVSVDNVVGATMAVNHLVELGHRRIAHLAGPHTSSSGSRRREGFVQAMRQRNLDKDLTIVEVPFNQEGGYQGTRSILAKEPSPTALFAANDVIAIGALLALRDAGMQVPNALSVVGFDDIPVAAIVSTPLTTIAQPKYQMGECATNLLLDRLSGREKGPGRRVKLDLELVTRSSTGPPPPA